MIGIVIRQFFHDQNGRYTKLFIHTYIRFTLVKHYLEISNFSCISIADGATSNNKKHSFSCNHGERPV